MLSFLHLKPKPIIGLDITADEIRLLQLKSTRQDIYVEKIAYCDMPSDAMVDGKIQNATLIRERIEHLVSISNSQQRFAAIAMPSQSIITKHIKLPANLTDEECEAEITNNLKEYFPGIVSSELCFDYGVINHTDVEFKHIQLTAARAETMNEFVDIVNQAGLVVKIVDVDLFALARAISFTMTSPSVTAVLDINPSCMRFIVVEHQAIIFNQLLVITNSKLFVMELIQQLKNVLNLFASTHRNISLQTLSLSGKILSSDIAHFIWTECGLKVEHVNPFVNMKFSSKIDVNEITPVVPNMLTCCGLALRGVLL